MGVYNLWLVIGKIYNQKEINMSLFTDDSPSIAKKLYINAFQLIIDKNP